MTQRHLIDETEDLFSALANAPRNHTRFVTDDGRRLTRGEARKRADQLADSVSRGLPLVLVVTGWKF